MAHPGGRPLKFKSAKELQEKIDAYFAECDPHWIDEDYWDYPELEVDDELEPQVHGGALKRKRKLDYDADMVLKTRKVKTGQIPYTITGLALALHTTRDLLIDYEDKDEFSDTIKEAKAKCHMYAEIALYGGSATGPIFSLKNNYGWKDKSEQDITSNGESVTPVVRIIDERQRDTDTE
jgi:hypothetical protein